MLTACVERLRNCLEEMKALLPTHYDELSEHKQRGIPLNPDYALYLRQDDHGELVVITLRDSGIMVGYLVSIITPGRHYQDCLTGLSDIFFIYPNKRGAEGGKLLFQEWERECRRRGVHLLMAGFKVKHAEHARALLELLGFFEAEIMFWKFLDGRVI